VKRHFALLAPALAAAIPSANGASTKTIAAIATDWGLTGAWSIDCKLPPDHERGIVLTYATTADGGVLLKRDFGDATDENKVVSAKVAPDGMMKLRVFFPSLKEVRELGLIKQPDGTLRAIYNRDSKRKYSIRDGRFTRSDMPTPVQHRCRKLGG
jgi:hypothetical protein